MQLRSHPFHCMPESAIRVYFRFYIFVTAGLPRSLPVHVISLLGVSLHFQSLNLSIYCHSVCLYSHWVHFPVHLTYFRLWKDLNAGKPRPCGPQPWLPVCLKLNKCLCNPFNAICFFLDNSQCSASSLAPPDYYSGSPYRIQRHAANIRERKRMLRSAIGPTGYIRIDMWHDVVFKPRSNPIGIFLLFFTFVLRISSVPRSCSVFDSR